jgi:hypothetical protein
VLLYGEWVAQNVRASVAQRKYALTLPRLLRPIYSRHRVRLGELCRIAPRLQTDTHAEAAALARPIIACIP